MRQDAQPEPTVWLRVRERAWLLIFERDLELLEVAYGLMMLGWGVQLLLPWDTFRTGLGYAVLAHLAPEWVWGALMFWIGVTKIGAYFLDHLRVRAAVTIGAVMMWTFLSVAFGLSNPAGTGIVVYPVLAFTSALIFWRLMRRRSGGY